MGSIHLGSAKDVPTRRRASDWIASRSRRFWLIVVASTILVLTLSIILGIYLTVRPHRQTSEIPIKPRDAPIIPGKQNNVNRPDLIHSYLVDINSADDESIRAAVQHPKIAFDSRIELLLLHI